MSNGKVFKLSESSSLLLNLLRGLAAQAVVIGHGISYFGVSDKLSYIQNSAVVIFFILSGIVIPYSMFNKRAQNPNYSFASYFLERFSRIYTGFVPALFFVLGMDILSKTLFGAGYIFSDALNVHTFFGNILMFQDHPLQGLIRGVLSLKIFSPLYFLMPITSFGSGRPFWTVAIEWWIYLLFGWIVLGKNYRDGKPLLYLFILMFLLVVPVFNWLNGRGNGLSMMWFMGLLVYIFLSRFPLDFPRWQVLFLIVLFLSCSVAWLFNSSNNNVYNPALAGVLALILYLSLSLLQSRGIVMPRALESTIIFNADISYMLYLVHYTLLDILYLSRGAGGWASVLIGFVLSNLAAILMYFVFDRHYKKIATWLKRSFNLAA